ncbi:MAG TPA: PadR family transcriptional regulator [Solirubrobacterales bacterium]|nr:PadR family transcriptional regulator [Solirubrobacterales bacterium]
MELSPTAYVILGMLRHGGRSGYEIKQAVDRSTRFFWAASYGQIYPELRKLAKAGLVEGEARPQGGRKRTVYRLTSAGRRALRDWLAVEPELLELRDEGLLKLFFADAADPGRAVEILDAKRRLHERKLGLLREVEPVASGRVEVDPYPYLVLRYGLEFNQWIVDWCERAKAELDAAGEAAETPRRKSDAR